MAAKKGSRGGHTKTAKSIKKGTQKAPPMQQPKKPY